VLPSLSTFEYAVVTIRTIYNKIQKLCLVVPKKKLCLILFSVRGRGEDYFSKLHEPVGIRKENTVFFFLFLRHLLGITKLDKERINVLGKKREHIT
jgi:hypothetical protein